MRAISVALLSGVREGQAVEVRAEAIGTRTRQHGVTRSSAVPWFQLVVMAPEGAVERIAFPVDAVPAMRRALRLIEGVRP